MVLEHPQEIRVVARFKALSDEAWLTDRNDPTLFLPTAGLSGHQWSRLMRTGPASWGLQPRVRHS